MLHFMYIGAWIVDFVSTRGFARCSLTGYERPVAHHLRYFNHANTSQGAPGKSAEVLDILTHCHHLTEPIHSSNRRRGRRVASAGNLPRLAKVGDGGHPLGAGPSLWEPD